MAETGATEVFVPEVQTLVRSGYAHEAIKGRRIDSPGQDSQELTFTIEHNLLTFVSMIAPSPDWFVGTNEVSMIQDGEWVDGFQIELAAYDAGTDSGSDFTSSDQDTQPRTTNN